MRVLFVASEAAPFAKTGGLGDVAGSLPPALAALDNDVRVVLPRYRSVDPAGLTRRASFYVPVASWQERCDVLAGTLPGGVPVYFIGKDAYFDRPGLYGDANGDYTDNAERFVFFCRAVLELCRAVRFRPDIIHCNDWQTGLVPLYLKAAAAEAHVARAGSVMTVHNLGYQGLFDAELLGLTGLGRDVFTPEGIEFWGRINFLKAGLIAADAITTVSPAYAREVQTSELGHGLDGVLRARREALTGILNGIDRHQWDPAKDRALARTYSASRPDGKIACTRALREELGLPDAAGPVVGMVSRLVEQKGVDLLAGALHDIVAAGCQVVVLGTGDRRSEELLVDAARAFPEQTRMLFRFDDGLARRIYAGSDLYLMPSRYEPCGLGQLIALRYGSVPVVRRTGGLADTVQEFAPLAGTGTGFLFDDPAPEALAETVRRAVAVRRDRAAWQRLVRNGMRQEFSWKRSAEQYVAVYKKARKTGVRSQKPEAGR